MPGGLAELMSLGVDPAGMPFRGIAYVSEQRRAEALFRNGPGRGVRRTTLHAALEARAKEQDTEWIRTKVTSVQQDAHGVTAAGVRAKWLVGADGLHSAVRRSVGIKVKAGNPRRYGVRWHFTVPAWSEFVEVYWSRRGEAYVTPVEPDLVGVAIPTGTTADGRPSSAMLLGAALADDTLLALGARILDEPRESTRTAAVSEFASTSEENT